jgi:uncharacterized protein (DUF1330 family)
MSKTKNDHIIMAIHVTDRVKQASLVQDILTKYGASIKTRIGLHEASETKASTNGLILVEFVGTQKKSEKMLAALNAVTGVEAKSIIFQH